MAKKPKKHCETPKPRDPSWKMRRALGHKVMRNAKRYDRKRADRQFRREVERI